MFTIHMYPLVIHMYPPAATFVLTFLILTSCDCCCVVVLWCLCFFALMLYVVCYKYYLHILEYGETQF